MRNPELFQGENKINFSKNYFEGWYFKNSNKNESISFIPGINVDENNKKAFIQVITNNVSYFIDYDIEDFKYNVNPFYIQINNNLFSKDGIYIDIYDKKQNLKINGKLKYLNSESIKGNTLNPNIMGPFSYIPFMECNHAILSMKNDIQGNLIINDYNMNFNNGTGYIEKDWGCSFPKSYIWCQGNNFKNSNASFMFSIADIPFKIFNFRGIISDLIIDNEEYKFTTYNNTKLLEYAVRDDFLNITLKKGKYSLNINSKYNKGLRLSAPVKGKMSKDILESISSEIIVTLKKDKTLIFSDISTNCGLEIV